MQFWWSVSPSIKEKKNSLNNSCDASNVEAGIDWKDQIKYIVLKGNGAISHLHV